MANFISSLDPQTQQILLQQKRIKRKETSLDIEAKFYKDKPSHRTGLDNKTIYLKNYGVYYSIPSIFILDANIFAKNPRYVFQLVKYVMPEGKIMQGFHDDEFLVQSH